LCVCGGGGWVSVVSYLEICRSNIYFLQFQIKLDA
jgi:hypothetical protein